MGKLKLQMQISVDGFVAGTKGEMDWMTFNWDDQLKYYVTELTSNVECIVLGRKLAAGFIPHWASAPEEEGAEFFNSTKKVVFTNTLTSCEWENTTLATGDLSEEINSLKAAHDVIVYGGGSFVSSLLRERLIDDLHLFINPVALGEGMSIFNNLGERQHLKLIDSCAFSCGIAVLHYGLAKG